MPDLRISLITVVHNAHHTLDRCITSILNQSFRNIEYIVIDGGSTDGTLDIIEKYKNNIHTFISEPDQGVYDAMNKGIALATGDIIGTLNSDDFYADNYVLQNVADQFEDRVINIVYGDLDYVEKHGRVIRKWRSGKYKQGILNWGWMPPHPTFYCRRHLFDQLGVYKLDYGSAADYELMLRFINNNSNNIYYLRKVIIKMMVGGISNKNLFNRVKAILYDLKAMRNNKILIPVVTILFKPLRKISQYF